MEENRIPIKVDISANLKSSIDRAKESQKELQAGGHLTSVQNSRLTANMEQIDSLMAKWTKDGDLTFLEYESLRKNLVSFNRIIEKAAESLGGISPEIKKLTAQSIDLNSKTANLEKDAAYYNGRGQFKNNPNTNKEEYSFRDSFLNNLSKKSFSDEFGVDNGFIYKNRKTPTKDIARAYGLFYGLNKTEREKKAEDSFGDNSSKALETYNAIHKKEIEESGKAKASQTALEENTKKIEENTTALKAAESTSKNPTIIKAQENINTATTEVGNAEISSKNQSTNLADTKSHIEQTTTAIQKQQTALGRAFKQFTLYALVIRAAKSALQECISTITELDKSLTTQAMVTGITRQQAYSLIGSYSELAKQTGATTKEIAEAASEYLKQGHSIQDSLTLTKAAVSAAKVAGISVSDSINYLTTAVNGYRLSAEDAMSVSDKFAALAASSATDYDELAIAMSKVASQAKLAGMSMDYTLALLTKGLETTREAPETMGTALKTVIARMREISDYGETLSDGTDINNVEKQLAYVGIALKNDSGELRSTEDVLDELGKKWDNLNTNQQAAIAKALAGTRQQSRLIAMMDDYERVTELQEISVRSAGATAAQAAVYLTGIEAKLNSIKVTWENIVESLSKNEIVLGTLDAANAVLGVVQNILSTSAGVLAVYGMIAVAAIGLLSKRIIENSIAEKQVDLENQKNIEALEEEKIQLTLQQMQIDGYNLDADKYALLKSQLKILERQGKQIDANNNAENKKGEAGNATTSDDLPDIKKKEFIDSYTAAQDKLNKTSTEYRAVVEKLNLLKTANNTINKSGYIIQAASIVLEKIAVVYDAMLIATGHRKVVVGYLNAKSLWAQTAAQEALNLASGQWVKLAVTAIAIIAVLAVAIIKNIKSPAESAAISINKLSEEIYTLNKKANDIKTAIDSFDKLDNKVLKTKTDLEEMNKTLSDVADKLTDDEKDIYDNLSTNAQKRAYLEQIESESLEKANEDRGKQVKILKSLTEEERKTVLTGTDSKYLEAQSALYALNNNTLYDTIDALKESGSYTNEELTATEELGQQLLENLSTEEAYNAEENKSVEKLTKKIATMAKLKTESGDTASIAEILTSDDYTLIDKVNAYNATLSSLSGSMRESFKTLYNQFEKFASFDEHVLKYIEKSGLTTDDLNTLYTSYTKLQKAGVKITQKEYQDSYDSMLQSLAATNGDIAETVNNIFGSYLDQFKKGSEEWNDAYNAFISSFGDLVEQGMLNMGQNIQSFKSSIDSVYTTASKWSTMSETDKTTFISDNADLFSESNGGAELLKALESNDYNTIMAALSNNANMQERTSKLRDEIDQEIKVEEARVGDARNEAYIDWLKEEKNFLDDSDDLYKASLATRLAAENSQLSEYKSYLQDQEDALEKSLSDRKSAYQKYFEAINKEADAEDYEKNTQTLIDNIARLSGSTNASAVSKTQDLTKKLADLEEERLKTLRQDAQDAVLNNMDTNLSEIKDKFDELINSNKALLIAMKGDSTDAASFISNLISNKASNGATEQELQSYISTTLQPVFGSLLGSNFDWSNIKVSHDTNNNLILTVNGQSVSLSDANQNMIYQVLMKALEQAGIRG